MKISKIDCHILLIPDYDVHACSSAQDDLVIEIHTDEGLIGIGETDTNPWVARECILRPRHALHGAGSGGDAVGLRSARSGSRMGQTLQRFENDRPPRSRDLRAGRDRHGAVGPTGQGFGKADLRAAGRAERPAGDALRLAVADRQHGGRTLRVAVGQVLPRAEARFRAAKLEVCINGPYSHNGLQADDAAGVEIVAACRQAVGPDFTLLLDVAYAWPSATRAGGLGATGALRSVLRRDADRRRRSGGLRPAARAFADTHCRRRVAKHALGILRPGRSRAGGRLAARRRPRGRIHRGAARLPDRRGGAAGWSCRIVGKRHRHRGQRRTWRRRRPFVRSSSFCRPNWPNRRCGANWWSRSCTSSTDT